MRLSLRQKELVTNLLYDRSARPFGRSWENWAARWYQWLFSIPKAKNPCLDTDGKYSSVCQKEQNVWFLAGTFGNTIPVRRKCVIPAGKAIFFPVLVKEDSFVEDTDLKTKSDLINRASKATDHLIHMEATVAGEQVANLEKYRVLSELVEVVFPEDNVYDVRPGMSQSVSDGFWLFIKPLPLGIHIIHFRGETLLVEPHTRNLMLEKEVYRQISDHINAHDRFKVDVMYELTIRQ